MSAETAFALSVAVLGFLLVCSIVGMVVDRIRGRGDVPDWDSGEWKLTLPGEPEDEPHKGHHRRHRE